MFNSKGMQPVDATGLLVTLLCGAGPSWSDARGGSPIRAGNGVTGLSQLSWCTGMRWDQAECSRGEGRASTYSTGSILH